MNSNSNKEEHKITKEGHCKNCGMIPEDLGFDEGCKVMNHKEEVPSKYEFPCTNCGGDATIGYGSDKKDSWDGKTKKGERLCTKCFRLRGGVRVF